MPPSPDSKSIPTRLQEELTRLRLRVAELKNSESLCHLSQENLREAHEFVEKVMDCTSNAIYTLDLAGRFMRINRRGQEISGYAKEELLGKPFTKLLEPGDRPLVSSYFKRAAGQGSRFENLELKIIRKDGVQRMLSLAVVPLCKQNQIISMVGTADDITERKRLEEQLRHLATTDGLTGLMNRRHFLEQGTKELERARRYGRPLSLLMMDLDDFKLFNEKHGHAGGDAVLKTFSRVCRSELRDLDLMGRMGGEEFAIMLGECDVIRAWQVGQRLRRKVAQEPLHLNGGQERITVSLGVAGFQPGESLEELLERADQALFKAKRQGKNQVIIAD